MLPSLTALSNSKRLHTLGVKGVNRDEYTSIGTPTKPGQLPWFPNVEDEDYKPDEESMDEEPFEYPHDDEREQLPQTPITYCMSGEAAIVALRADMHNFVGRYNKQVDELSNSPSVVQSATMIAEQISVLMPNPNRNRVTSSKEVQIRKVQSEWLDRLDLDDFMVGGSVTVSNVEDIDDEIEEMLQIVYDNKPIEYEQFENCWKHICDRWEGFQNEYNAKMERYMELVHEGRIYYIYWRIYFNIPSFGLTVEQMILKTVIKFRTDMYITEAAVDAIQQIVSNLLVTVDNMNPESKEFVLRLYLTLQSMEIDATARHLAYGEDDSDEIRNKNYLGDPLVSRLVYSFLEFILPKLTAMTEHVRSKVIQLRDVGDTVASILRGHALPVWDRARAKIMAYIRMRRAQIEAAERTYAPGGQGAEEAATSFARQATSTRRDG